MLVEFKTEQDMTKEAEFEDADGNIEPATAERVIVRHDAIWVVGEDDSLHTLLHNMVPPKSAQNPK